MSYYHCDVIFYSVFVVSAEFNVIGETGTPTQFIMIGNPLI